MISYCLKCKRRVKMIKEIESKVNGRKILKGECSKCGTNMSKFI